MHDASSFAPRHLGPRDEDLADMLRSLGLSSLEELADAVVPDDIRLAGRLSLDPPRSEAQALARIRELAAGNQIYRSLIGMGYHGTDTPPVIQRNILENPLWYTPYTPYQPEISQGRLEALLNFQTAVADLTAMDVANASLLDEATAAAEAMSMCHGIARGKKPAFFAADDCHPQTLNVLRTRAGSVGIELRVGPVDELDLSAGDVTGVLVQYPSTYGQVRDHDELVRQVHTAGGLVVVAADLLALTLLRPPGEWADGGADIVVGTSQRFGVPMGYGGPHAAYIATRDKHVRKLPGRIVGVSKDSHEHTAFRLAIQTREQHIKRDKATSNICTAQVLLAVMAGMYAVWHGPEGLRRIAERVQGLTAALAAGLRQQGHDVPEGDHFDTLAIKPVGADANAVIEQAEQHRINLRPIDEHTVGVSLDEQSTAEEVRTLLQVFATATGQSHDDNAPTNPKSDIRNPKSRRTTTYLAHPVFHRYRSETEMMRYITRLQNRDISLAHSMIPLGSCTMKLNAAAEMMPITWPEFAHLHPYAPAEQTRGYQQLFDDLTRWLAEITGLPAVSLQPNAGSQGEYAGLLAIRAYHESRGDTQRDVCLIPTSAHGTNPASAVIAGMRVAAVQCDARGNVDIDDLQRRIDEHGEAVAALMLTYPSTHGVFEAHVRDICQRVHDAGGQVYLDGANLNAQLGLTRPDRVGADVVHLNLHKTFCIPHGGGGPGMGPIAVAEHLAPFLPGDPLDRPEALDDRYSSVGPIAAAGCGSPAILPISWMYIAMMGEPGLRKATQVAILNANYMAKRLEGHYDVLYTGHGGWVAHEFIIDCRPFQKTAGVTVDDIAKRLIDFGFHSPTMSFPVPGTLMIEPTESESKQELDRFCEALIAIREEIRAIERGELAAEASALRHAPHTAEAVTADDWPHAYSRQAAAFPLAWVRQGKYWPPVGRIDQAWGDRNLACACPPMEAYCEL